MIENGFYNMDCIDGMKEFPDKYFSLAIVDPPYGIRENPYKQKQRGKLAKSRNYKAFYGDDKEPPPQEYFDELMRVSQNQIIFGANHFISRIPYDSHCWIVWDKDNQGTDFADCELAWTSFPTAVRRFRYRWNGMLQENMKNKEIRIHPTQKPVALYRWLLTNYYKDGIVLDTHVGSASSLIACHDMGIEYVGFELSDYYYKLAKERLEDHKAQLSIFDLGVERS